MIERLVDEVEEELKDRYATEVDSKDIGEVVMKKLQALDQVAYVRFASYYKEFKDAKSFEEELKKMKEIRKKGSITRVKKRDGEIVGFDQNRITEAIMKAAEAVGGKDEETAKKLSDEVVAFLEERFGHMIPTVENIQYAVEKILVENCPYRTAKAYILYRKHREETRDMQAVLSKFNSIVGGYIGKIDWRVYENSNTSYSFSGFQSYASGAIVAEYTLNNIYPKEVADAHRNADLHIHNLGNGVFTGYCAGWSLGQLLMEGFNGVTGRISAKPAKHFDAVLGQIMNFMGTLQNEWAGAQAFSSFDTCLAPFVRHDSLSYGEVKQGIQEFIFGINQTSRWGNQVPFTNLTFDWTVPGDMKDQNVIIGGKLQKETYSEFQKEMDMINRAFIEVMMEGDMNGRIFTFPIPTYNITKDFDWDSDNTRLLFEMTAKYGTPYFQNFVNSSLKPTDVRSMCCRLQLDLRELRSKTGGLFGSGELTGSIGVVTINMPKIGYLSKTREEFFDRLSRLMDIAKTSLEIKRKEVERHMENGLLPYSKRYLGNLNHHFSTIGLVGMNEACMNFLGKNNNISTPESKAFVIEVLDFMRKKLQEFQQETGHIYNLEATPAEGTAYRLAKHDKDRFPDIITSGTDKPYYTNSTQLPVNFTTDIFEALMHQDELQTKYTGGTVLHGFLGERVSDWKVARELVRRIFHNFRLPYITLTPTFSICPVHGYIKGEHFFCPNPHTEKELKRYGVDVPEIKMGVN